jgi:hypothetical protein
MDEITVTIEGKRDATAILTWAQRRTWRGSRRKYRPFVQILTLSPGKTVQEVRDAVKWAYEEFESLRTVFPVGADGSPYQKVGKTGSVKILIIDEQDSNAESGTRIAIQQLTQERFDVTSEFGVMFAMVTCTGATTQLIFAASHLAVDAHGCGALKGALDRRLSGNHSPSSKPPLQPIERALEEQTEKLQQKSTMALQYWREVLEKFPRGDAGGRAVAMDSPALRTAVSIISKTYRVTTSAAYLAAVSVVAGALIGRSTCSFVLPAANRATPEERSFVGELVQFAPGILESLEKSFGDIVRDAGRASFKGYMFSQYDEQALLEMLQDLDEGGENKRAFDFSFNDMRSSMKLENNRGAGNLRDAMKQTRITLEEAPFQRPGRFMSASLMDEDETHIISISVHSSYFPTISAQRVSLAVEALAVELAAGDTATFEHPMRFAREYLGESPL